MRLSCLIAVIVACSSSARSATFKVSDYGVAGGGVASDTAAVQRAIDACADQGGGRVEVPAGKPWVVGTLILRSHVELHLERGAMIQGSPRHSDFTRFATPPVNFEAAPAPRMGVIIYADGADDVAITGDGRIDGNDRAYVTAFGKEIYTCADLRPFSVLLKDCRHVLLRDITLSHAAFWTLRLLGCDDALVDAVRIDGDILMPNNDGIDIDWSSNVRIRGCNISTGDDCISLKTAPLSLGVARPCENIVITGCTLTSRSCGVVLGCDAAGPIRNVVVSDCVITDSHRGVAVRLSLEGSIERVLFSNLVISTRIYDPMWWGRGEPIQVAAVPWTASTRLGVIRDIRFSNLLCTGENGALVYAEQPGHIESVSFDRVSIRVNRPARYLGPQQDIRPADGDGLPRLPTSGFQLRNAAGVSFRDCSVSWGPNPPDYFQHALSALGCPDLDPSGLAGPGAHSADSAQYILKNP